MVFKLQGGKKEDRGNGWAQGRNDSDPRGKNMKG